MRLPVKSPSYTIPGLTPEQNAVYSRNLWEMEMPNPYLRVVGNSSTVANASTQGVIWGNESTFFPRQGIEPLTTGTTYVEIPYDGLWTVDAQVGFVASTAGERGAILNKVSGRGQVGIFAHTIHGPGQTAGAVWRIPVHATVPLYKGDRIALQASQDSGVPQQQTGGEDVTWLSLSGVGVRAST